MPRSANARVFIERAILVGILLLLTVVVPGLAHQPKPEVSESDEKSDKKQHKQTPKYERAAAPSLYLARRRARLATKTCRRKISSRITRHHHTTPLKPPGFSVANSVQLRIDASCRPSWISS
jgi:hypothetical protein